MSHIKTAINWGGLLAALKGPTARGIAGTALGVGAGEAASEFELNKLRESGVNVGEIGSSGSRLINMGLGGLFGSRWGREILKGVHPETGVYGYRPGKILSTLIGKGSTVGLPILADQAVFLGAKGQEAAQGLGDAGKALSNMAEKAEKGVGSVVDSATLAADDIQKATKNISQASDPVTQNIVSATGNVDKATREIAGAASNTSDAMKGVSQISSSADKLQKTLEPIGKFFEWVPKAAPKGLMYGGGALLGAGALYGGYNLLRDKLNYNRIKAEREAKQHPREEPKTAAAPWANFLFKKVLPTTALGAGEGYLNYEMDPSHPALAAMGGLIGAYGGSKMFRGARGNFSFNPGSLKSVLPMALVPRGIAALQAVTKNQLAQADIANASKAQDSSLGTAAKWIGGAALGGGALYALLQGARAAKRVGDGEPLSNTTVFQGSGGPDNPNVGGKLHVTLPTKKPGDHETVVELPLENVPLSHTIIQRIQRDTKRRLRSESAARTRTIGNQDQVDKMFAA